MHLMTPGELRFWVVEGDYVSCRKCHVQHQAQERLRNRVCVHTWIHTRCSALYFTQERTLLKRLQEELFPKMRRKLSLKKIASGQQWNGTASFMEGYRYETQCDEICHTLSYHRRPSRRVQDLEQQLARWEETEHVVPVFEVRVEHRAMRAIEFITTQRPPSGVALPNGPKLGRGLSSVDEGGVPPG